MTSATMAEPFYEMPVGLPATVILNREGQDNAPLRGDADWYSDSARAMVAEMIGTNVGE